MRTPWIMHWPAGLATSGEVCEELVSVIDMSLISLKKTSASRLRNNDKFNSVRSLFLGHAEVRVADQHYAENPKELLDRALEWLRGELGIDQLQLKK